MAGFVTKKIDQARCEIDFGGERRGKPELVLQASTMSSPLIAIVGSVEAKRTYEHPVRNHEKAPAAGEAIGRALAEKDCRLLVWDCHFVEADVVRGYVASGKAKPKSIVVRYQAATDSASLPEARDNPDLFDAQPSNSPRWEVTYYRSLDTVDGVILVGGGRSTLVTGLIALTYRIPLVAVRGFGGAAEEIWSWLRADQDLPTQAQINEMGVEWREELAGRWIDSLRDQRERRRALEKKPGAARYFAVFWIFAFALMIPLSLKFGGTPWAIWVLAMAPILAGGAGGSFRSLVDEQPEGRSPVVRGMAGGLVSALLYTIPQLFGLANGGAQTPMPPASLLV